MFQKRQQGIHEKNANFMNYEKDVDAFLSNCIILFLPVLTQNSIHSAALDAPVRPKLIFFL